MDNNEIINQLREENEQLKQLNTAALNVVFRIKDAAIALGCEANDGMAMLGYLIETAIASVMVNQKNVELVDERDALAAQVQNLTKGDWTPEQYHSIIKCQAIVAHDAEVINNLAIYICDRAFKGQLSKSEIIHYASEYAAQLRAKAGA